MMIPFAFVIEAVEVGDDFSEVLICKCPWCNGLFGIDCSYVDQVMSEDDTINCNMCNHMVQIPDDGSVFRKENVDAG